MQDDGREPDGRPPVPLAKIANEVGYSPNTFRRVAQRRNFVPFQLRQAQNAPYFLTAHDAEALIEQIKQESELRIAPQPNAGSPGLSGVYAVEAPSYENAIRLKIGWSDDIESRLSSYRTLVPDLRVRRIWPTINKWCESMALEWAINNGDRIAQEVFEFRNVENALSGLDTLFSLINIKSQEVNDGTGTEDQ
jgi:hypothetical protein